jgi:hypothetical protein
MTMTSDEAIERAIRHRDYPHEHLSPKASREIILGLLDALQLIADNVPENYFADTRQTAESP